MLTTGIEEINMKTRHIPISVANAASANSFGSNPDQRILHGEGLGQRVPETNLVAEKRP